MRLAQLAAAVIFVAASVLSHAEVIVDLPAIAGKSAIEVARMLGQPSGQEKTKHGPKMLYRAGKVEVVFINGKADWITVSELGAHAFGAETLAQLGLKPVPPTFQSSFELRWEPCGPFQSVSLFAANGQADYAYIKTSSK